MDLGELVWHLASAYRQGMKANVIADCRGIAVNALSRLATPEQLANNDIASAMHLEDGLSSSESAAAFCLRLCVGWQALETPNDEVAGRIFLAMTGFKSLAIERRSQNRANAKKPRENARRVDHEDLLAAFRSLVTSGHTDREARGILLSRGCYGSQSTIYRITKKSSS